MDDETRHLELVILLEIKDEQNVGFLNFSLTNLIVKILLSLK
jgi:hypothetical protein